MTKQDFPTAESSSSRYLIYVIGLVLAAGVTFTLLRMLLPILRVMLPIAIGWWLWRRWQKMQQQKQAALDAIFYQLLQEHQGQITVLDFAMTAQLPAGAAKDYLDSRAKDFSAQFEVTDRGDIYYLFPTLKSPKFQSAIKTTLVRTEEVMAAQTLPVIAPMTQAQLARRLQVSAGAISRKKLAPDLLEWSKVHDPDGVGWAYQPETRQFLPMTVTPD